MVAKQALPAGPYIVRAVGDAQVRIFNSKTTGFFVPTHGALRTVSDGRKLVFHPGVDSYFLSQVWVTGDTIGRVLTRSRLVREAAEHRAEMELAVIHPAKARPAH